jgi:hypothetical protein
MSTLVNQFTKAVKHAYLNKSFMEAGIYKASTSINHTQPTNSQQPNTISTI